MKHEIPPTSVQPGPSVPKCPDLSFFDTREDDFNFTWDSGKLSLPKLQPPDTKRSIWRAKKVFADIVHDITALEGNPFTLPEVQTLLEGITVGGRRVADAEQVLNQKESLTLLFGLVENGVFSVTKEVAFRLQGVAAKGEALEEGVFRTGKVGINGTSYQPPAPEDIPKNFEKMVEALNHIENPLERGITAFLCIAKNQMFWDGNKRTGRLLMNGILLSAGQDIITIPKSEHLNFNKKMISFYESGDGTEMINFLSKLQIRNRFE